ncbi:alpha-(1,6)-fucosyltransferase-like isoform X1 [Styela clava]
MITKCACFAAVLVLIFLQVYVYQVKFRKKHEVGYQESLRGIWKMNRTVSESINLEDISRKLLIEYNKTWRYIITSCENSEADNKYIQALEDGYLLLRSRIERVLMLVSNSKNNSIELAAENFITFWNLFSDIKHFWMKTMSVFRNIGLKEDDRETLGNKFWFLLEKIKELIKASEIKRKKILDDLSIKVTTKIHKLQNPRDCMDTRLLICKLNTKLNCGFGCETHSLISCMMEALRSQRTLIYITEGWRYAKQGREYTFSPLNNCSTYSFSINPYITLEGNENATIIKKYSSEYKEWIGWSIPRQLSSTLQKYHAEPFLWWIGQLIKYAMKLQPWMEEDLNNIITRVGFSSPVVGIQIRRGDKLKDSGGFHEVDEYMFYADQYFNYLKTTNKHIQPKVFLATEDESALPELTLRYPDYKFIVSNHVTEKVTKHMRYGDGGLEGIIFDILLLSRCDYIVCTLSSNVCRAAYEAMSANRVDAATRIHSLDTGHRLKTLFDAPWRATANHTPINSEELRLHKGDKVKVSMSYRESLKDGYVMASNRATGEKGRIPAYKAREELTLLHFSIFDL